jgi:hypothetical protein
MDPSPAVLPFRMLEYQVRRKSGLVIPPDGAPHFEETPADSPVPNTWLEEIDGKVSEDGTLDATVSITARGDAELSPRQAFIGPVESVWPYTVQGVVKGINRRTDKVSEVKISDPKATNEPFTFSFRVSKPLFVDLSKGAIEFRLPLSDFGLPPSDVQGVTDARVWHRLGSEAVHLGPPGKRTYRVKLELARSFALETPAPLTLERDYGSYRASYKLDSNSLTAEREFVTSKDELPPATAGEYSVFRKKVIADLERIVPVQIAHQPGGQM